MTAPLLAFTVEGVPRPRERARKGSGGRWYTPMRTVAYQQAVAWAALRAVSAGRVRIPLAARVRLVVRCFFPDRRVRDADGVQSTVMDALKKASVIADDRWTMAEPGGVPCALDRKRPRIEVELWRAEVP